MYNLYILIYQQVITCDLARRHNFRPVRTKQSRPRTCVDHCLWRAGPYDEGDSADRILPSRQSLFEFYSEEGKAFGFTPAKAAIYAMNRIGFLALHEKAGHLSSGVASVFFTFALARNSAEAVHLKVLRSIRCNSPLSLKAMAWQAGTKSGARYQKSAVGSRILGETGQACLWNLRWKE